MFDLEALSADAVMGQLQLLIPLSKLPYFFFLTLLSVPSDSLCHIFKEYKTQVSRMRATCTCNWVIESNKQCNFDQRSLCKHYFKNSLFPNITSSRNVWLRRMLQRPGIEKIIVWEEGDLKLLLLINLKRIKSIVNISNLKTHVLMLTSSSIDYW